VSVLIYVAKQQIPWLG